LVSFDSLKDIETSNESHDAKDAIEDDVNNCVGRNEVEIETSNVESEDTTSDGVLEEFKVLFNKFKLNVGREDHETKENIISSYEPIGRAEERIPKEVEDTNSTNSQTNDVIGTVDSLIDGFNVREGESFFVIDFIHVILKKFNPVYYNHN